MAVAEEHNPAQQAVLDMLGAPLAERPVFRRELAVELRAELETGLEPVVHVLDPEESLFLAKHRLALVHGCEQLFLAEDGGGFEWSAAKARGTIAHKAVELSVHWRGTPTPLELVDEAMARVSDSERGLGDWLQTMSEVERAELRSAAGDHVTKFLECFPPLSARWRPVCEARLRQELCRDRVVLQGKADLTLGMATGMTAGKVIIDLKSGGFAPAHIDDLRFYALVEALRMGVPPRLVATYYLDAGRLVPEEVTEAVLWATAARVVDGAGRMVTLRQGNAEPVTRPGPPCRWCPLQSGCSPGREYLALADERAGW